MTLFPNFIVNFRLLWNDQFSVCHCETCAKGFPIPANLTTKLFFSKIFYQANICGYKWYSNIQPALLELISCYYIEVNEPSNKYIFSITSFSEIQKGRLICVERPSASKGEIWLLWNPHVGEASVIFTWPDIHMATSNLAWDVEIIRHR